MKIFIVGLPKSGRTTVSKFLADSLGFNYVDAASWIRSTFRGPTEDEHPHQFEDEYQQYLSKRLEVNPKFVSDYVLDTMKMMAEKSSVFVIDGIFNPRDFISLFDYRTDIVIVLNRVGFGQEFRDYEDIGISVMKDYCFWMSSIGLISKERWIEYNYKIPGEESSRVKYLGSKNTVFIVNSINKAMEHLKEQIKELLHAIPK